MDRGLTKVLFVRIAPKEHEQVEHIAKDDTRSISELCRVFIMKGIAAQLAAEAAARPARKKARMAPAPRPHESEKRALPSRSRPTGKRAKRAKPSRRRRTMKARSKRRSGGK